jgi:hypothetical protein
MPDERQCSGNLPESGFSASARNTINPDAHCVPVCRGEYVHHPDDDQHEQILRTFVPEKFFYLLTCEYCLSHMSLFGRLRLDIRQGRLEIENTPRETQGAAEAGNRADA